MAKGWAELLKEVRRLRAREELDLEAVWDAFEELASGSQHTSTLRIALRLGETLSASQRYLLALIVMRLLAPVEWPEEWASVRPRLVTGIAHLLREIDPRTEDSFSALLELQADAAVQAVGHVMLQIAHDLLSKPCRRSDLRQAA
ncbi:MAG TPA: hypothetical protein VL242_39945, partial [Sorangium sp.]|nr:hypothetical protein [Sorangium sp.]